MKDDTMNQISFRYVKQVLNDVSKLFPKEVQHRCIDENYYAYLWILENTVPYLKENVKILDVGAGGASYH